MSNAGMASKLRPGDIFLDDNAWSYIYLGYFQGTSPQVKKNPQGPGIPSGYLYLYFWVDCHKFPTESCPENDLLDYPDTGIIASISGNFRGCAHYVKNPKHFWKKLRNIDLSRIQPSLESLYGLTYVGPGKPKNMI